MKKILAVLLCLAYPLLALADSALSFTPPSTDYSVIFLGNLFGVVDGVLHGSGSQIMSKMFGVFNAAVLALGGIVVTYTLIVGTMNTSQEGQFLGQKWSSIWIPVRSTIGLALLIPKTSGYCLMQIFIMWVTVQGVGAADKIWNAALDYLNTGGVIVQAQATTGSSSTNSTAREEIATGESAILQGQICMYGMQKLLETARTDALDAKEAGSGPCLDSKTKTDSTMKHFCENVVPNFLSTVSAVEASNLGNNYVDMPNFTDGSDYKKLNGICGKIAWTKLDMASDTSDLDYVTAEDIDTLNESRPIAIQQMYMDFMPVATAMVENDPEITKNTAWDPDNTYNTVAQDQYGIPYLNSTQTPCSGIDPDCMNWNAASSNNTQSYIFTGLEFMNAMTDYNAIMMPVLNLQSQNNDAETNNNYHEFIQGAEDQGWIMAGAYFFDLAKLNGSVQAHSDDIDTDSGLKGSTPYSSTPLTSAFSDGCTGQYQNLCFYLSKDQASVNKLDRLITGADVEDGLSPNVGGGDHAAVTTIGSATGYGYINNASMIQLPGQPGLQTPTFKLNVNIKPNSSIIKMPKASGGCGFKILMFCVGGPLIKALWDEIIGVILDQIIDLVTNVLSLIVQTLLIVPLDSIMTILNEGVQLLNTTQSHPIVAMAYMGSSFINYVTTLYFQLIAVAAALSFVPFGLGDALYAVILPFIGAWASILFGIGFIDAYYIPFLPYMIFTFGSIAWLMAVIEAMVAGPIVALGVSHPEGHDALGKAEQAIMILINVFLRPAMMIIGYIAGIALCYVAIFIINSGFSHVLEFLMPSSSNVTGGDLTGSSSPENSGTPYTNFAALFAGFFGMLIYTMIYMTVVEKSFNLIYMLPDNILRWIGGTPEQIGKEAAGWGEGYKRELEQGAFKETGKAAQSSTEGVASSLLPKKKGKGDTKTTVT